jgi:ribosomal-protein-alanine N-acetyltransferase
MSALGRVVITSMSQDEAEKIAQWRYEAPYDFYDADADHRDLAELLDPLQRGDNYFSAHNAADELIGYFGFVCVERIVGIGLALRPDLTGRGLGQPFLEAGLDFARERLSARAFKLAVAAFNERAITVYERAGFVRTRAFEDETNGGLFSFVEMERPA